MSSLVGQSIGRYRILEEIGAGGMGVVYRAHDERLDRDLALKVLSPGTLDDPVARKRFRNEALLLSRLNHPAIQTIHDFETQDGRDFLVSELVPGTSLDVRIEGGALPEREVVRLGVQLAQGLAAAHGEGVLHRDLKPANLRVTPDGRLKILDFGLATSRQVVMAMSTATDIVDPNAAVGGTLPYMSPEQLLSEKLDERSDIYSAGAVLYEMATARRPFPETNATRLTDAILHQQPAAPTSLNRKLSPEMERIVLKCLEKDPELRYQSAKELAADLRRMEILSESRPAVVTHTPGKRRNLAVGAGMAVAAALAITAALLLWRSSRQQHVAGPLRFEQVTRFTDSAMAPAISPDGRVVAFIRGPGNFGSSAPKGQVYVKQLPDGDSIRLTDDQYGKATLAFSPDASRLAFTRVETNNSWNTWVAPVLGGAPRLMMANATGLSWIGPDQMLFSEIRGSGVHMAVVTASAGRTGVRDVYVPPTEAGMAHRTSLSPDRKWVLIVEMDSTGWMPCRLVSFDSSSPGRQVGPRGACSAAQWSPDGRWMYFTANAGGAYHIWRQRFPDGQPEALTSGITEEEGLAIMPDGRSLITAAGIAQSTIWMHDRKGDRQVVSEGFTFLPTLSPDRKTVYYLQRSGSSRSYGSGELWAADLDSGRAEPVLPGFILAFYSIAQDGKRALLCAAGDDARAGIWLVSLDREFSPLQLTRGGEFRAFFGAPGEIIYMSNTEPRYLYRMKEDGSKREQVLPEPILFLSAISPDGRWAAVNTPVENAGHALGIKVVPLHAGSPSLLCDSCTAGLGPGRLLAPIVSWSADGRYIFASLQFFGTHSTSTLVLPVRPDAPLPNLTAQRSPSEATLAAIRGSRLIPEQNVFSGADANTYLFMRTTAQTNLYRVHLPE